ncbi:MAG: DMT family transporter [Spirochaetes bacterium]|nr:DMT family transporter [Spirochaetota bacterium]
MSNGIHTMITPHTKGILYVLLSAVTFSLSTVFAKYITSTSPIHGIEVSFVRFLIGFIISSGYIIIHKMSIRPNHIPLVLTRAVSNTVAVILFFVGVQYTTVTNANMLNMTYPVFVFVLAPLFNKERIVKINFLYLMITLIGTYLVILPHYSTINIGDIYSFLSAIISAIAVVALRESRKYDSTSIILFHLMSIGLVINGLAMIPVFTIPDTVTFVYMLLSGLSAYLGQAFFTAGFKFIDATSGSIVSSSRIFIAACMGIYFFNDACTTNIIVGGLLITVALIGVSLQEHKDIH